MILVEHRRGVTQAKGSVLDWGGAIRGEFLPPPVPKDEAVDQQTQALCGPWHCILALVVTECSAVA